MLRVQQIRVDPDHQHHPRAASGSGASAGAGAGTDGSGSRSGGGVSGGFEPVLVGGTEVVEAGGGKRADFAWVKDNMKDLVLK